MKVEVGKKYTSNGKEIRILCTDRFSVLGNIVLGMFNDGNIRFFTENGEYLSSEDCNLVEVWQPQLDEWCWFLDDNNYNTVLAKFELIHNDKRFKCNAGGYWQHCIKFTGELPEHLKLKIKDIK
jgi:hypothetical protein